MNCEQFSDSYELYALNALGRADRDALEEHLAEGCRECSAEIRRAVELNEIILRCAPRVEPRPELRKRIVETFGAPAAKRGFGWLWPLAWAAAVTVMVVLGVGFNMERQERLAQEAASRSAAEELTRMASIVQILQAPGTKQVTFGPTPAVAPHGSLFVHQKLGIILIAGGLPAPPAGWNYESWVVPKNGTPKPVEPFQAGQGGRAVSVIPGPLDLADIKAVAVSMELSNTTPTKPTKVLFAAAIGT